MRIRFWGLICTLSIVMVLVWPATPVKALLTDTIHVDLEDIPEEIPIFDLVVCEWYELPTIDGTKSWIVHAGEDIADMHFFTWDDTEYMAMRDMEPIFTEWSRSSTEDVPGGPPVIPESEWKTYGQILDVWGGTGMSESHYYQISINKIPKHDGQDQSLWIHPTPEPATICLLGLGGLLLRRRKRS